MKPASSYAVSCVTKSPQTDLAARFAASLLAELGSDAVFAPSMQDHPAIAWKRAGLFDLSGAATDVAKMAPFPLASAADGGMLALRTITANSNNLPLTGAQLLGERARLMRLRRNGRASPTGHCRLINCANGRIGLNLARADDWDLLPALLEAEASNWSEVEAAAADLSADALVERGAEMGMAIACDGVPKAGAWLRRQQIGQQGSRHRKKPLVVDLSSLWAGPLAGNLLQLSGARIIKVESTHRPDGARSGNADFFNLLNAGKQCVALDFRSDQGRKDLIMLLQAADIVIEASRPRALRQLGAAAEQLISDFPGKVWLRIMAHGDDENRIGFGDDIGVAAGLPTLMERAWGEPLMVGDAIADPLTGIFGALAALECWQSGGGVLAEISMRDVVLRAAQLPDDVDLPTQARDWQETAETSGLPLYPHRETGPSAEEAGQSTSQVMRAIC